MLEPALQEFLAARDLTLVRVLNTSHHKGTVIALVQDGQCEWVLKWLTDTAGQRSAASLAREGAYYQLQKDNSTVPALGELGRRFLLTRFASRQTLRAAIGPVCLPAETVYRQSCHLAQLIQAFNGPVASDCIAPLPADPAARARRAILRKAKDILLGGPRGARSSIWQRVRLQLTYRLAYPWLWWQAGQLGPVLVAQEGASGRRYHGDCHTDNILVGDDDALYLVDFECSEEVPGLLLDGAFCYATYAIQHQHPEVSRSGMRDTLFPSGGEPSEFPALCDFFYQLCALNPRFAAPASGAGTVAGFTRLPARAHSP